MARSDSRQPQLRQQHEAGAEGADHRAEGIEGVDPGVHARCVVEIDRERLGEHRDRGTHQVGTGNDQHCAEANVEDEGEELRSRTAARRNLDGNEARHLE